MTELRNQINNIVQDHQECLVLAKSVGSSDINYIPRTEVVVSATEPTEENRKAIWLQKGKALCPIHFELGSMFSTNAPHVTTAMVNYLVKKGKTYTVTTDIPLSSHKVMVFLTSEKVPAIKNNTSNTTLFQSFEIKNGSITFTPGKDGYISVEISHRNGQGFYGAWDFSDDSPITKINNTYSFTLVEGDEAITEEYIEPKLYMLNINGEYVEMQ